MCDLPRDDRHHDAPVEELRGIALADLKRIDVHHGDVGNFAGRERAEVLLAEFRVGRPGRPAADRLFDRQRFLTAPAAGEVDPSRSVRVTAECRP